MNKTANTKKTQTQYKYKTKTTKHGPAPFGRYYLEQMDIEDTLHDSQILTTSISSIKHSPNIKLKQTYCLAQIQFLFSKYSYFSSTRLIFFMIFHVTVGTRLILPVYILT